MTCDRVQIINKGQLVFADKIENLNQRMQASSLVLGLANSPTSQEIATIEKVEDVEELGNGRWRIHFQPEQSPAELLAESAVEKSWGLYELSPEQKSLEQIFVDITTTEANAAEGKVA